VGDEMVFPPLMASNACFLVVGLDDWGAAAGGGVQKGILAGFKMLRKVHAISKPTTSPLLQVDVVSPNGFPITIPKAIPTTNAMAAPPSAADNQKYPKKVLSTDACCLQ
jgi:hypothetical protein